MFKFIKKHKWLVSGLLTLTIITSILGVQFVTVPQHQGATIGQGTVVLKIGTVEASGTVDYVCDGVDDDIQFQGALDALPANGGTIELLAGNYDLANGTTVTRALANVTIVGTGRGTYITGDGATAIFTAGGNNWTIRDLRTDAGSLAMGATTGWSWENVTINATYYAYRTDDATTASSWNIPTGRTATYVVAASDAPAGVKAQADYVSTGVAGSDDELINTAIAALPAGQSGRIILSSGRFSLNAYIDINRSYLTLEGQLPGAEHDTGKAAYLSSAGTTLYIGANDAAIRFTQEGGANVRTIEIKNLGIKSDDATYGNSFGIILNNCWDTHISRVRLTDLAQKAIWSTGGTAFDDVTIENCVVVNCGVGFYFDTGSQLHLINNYTNANSAWGYEFTGVTDVRALFNISDGDTSGGFYIGATSNPYDLTFIGNRAYGSVAGWGFQIGLDNAAVLSGLIMTNNRCDNNAEDYRIIGSGGTLQYSMFNNNYGQVLNITGTGQITDFLITENLLLTPGITDSFAGTETRVVKKDNALFIAPGEVRTTSGSLTAGNANAIAFAWHNPEAQDIYIKKVVITVTTSGGTVGSHLDVGIADDAAGTNRGTEFFNDLLLNNTGVYDSTDAASGGTQTVWVLCQDSASATDGWVVSQILDGNADELVGSYYVEYVGK